MFREDDGYVSRSDRIGHFFVYIYIGLGVLVSISILVWVQAGFVTNGTFIENFDKLVEIIIVESIKQLHS